MAKPFPACAKCALRDEPLVPGVTQRDGKRLGAVLFVGEAPGIQEVKRNAPFVGPSGYELEAALGLKGPLAKHGRTNAVLCRPADNDLGRVRRRAKKAGLEDPVKCCNARLQAEIRPYDRVVLLGATAVEAALRDGSDKGTVMDLRGFPIERERTDARGKSSDGGGDKTGQVRTYFPTVHPAHVLRRTRWRHVFRADIQKAFRAFDKTLRWKDVQAVTVTTAAQVEALHREAVKAKRLVLDIETYGEDALEPLVAPLGLLGMCVTRDHVLVVPFYSRDRATVLNATGPIRDACRALLADKRVTLTGQNAGSYDRTVLDREFGIDTTGRWDDTILLHHTVESELPHNLQYVASMYTDVHQWKADRGGSDIRNDRDWRQYNANDVAVTAEIYPQLRADVALRDQDRVVEFDHRMQEFCVDLHRVGLHLDRTVQARHAKALAAEAAAARAELVRAAAAHGLPDFNPGSTHQLAGLLFDRLKLPYDPEWETDGGNRGTSSEVFRELLANPIVTGEAQRVLLLVHAYRRAQKFLSTFVESAKPLADGRVHFQFNAHATVSGRFSSRAHQLPKKMRDMFTAEPGHVLVGADMDQIELRFIVALARIAKYEKVFAAGGDPHAVTCELLYGQDWRAQETADGKLRSFAKRFSYNNLYGGGAHTVWKVIRATEDTEAVGGANPRALFPYLDLKESVVASKQKLWLDAIPELKRWWKGQEEKFARDGYLRDPVLGRRRDFLDGLQDGGNDLKNFEVQAGARALVAQAAHRLREEFGYTADALTTTGALVYDGHDQLVIECPEARVAQVTRDMTTCMNVGVEWSPVRFTSKAKAARDWAHV